MMHISGEIRLSCRFTTKMNQQITITIQDGVQYKRSQDLPLNEVTIKLVTTLKVFIRVFYTACEHYWKLSHGQKQTILRMKKASASKNYCMLIIKSDKKAHKQLSIISKHGINLISQYDDHSQVLARLRQV